MSRCGQRSTWARRASPSRANRGSLHKRRRSAERAATSTREGLAGDRNRPAPISRGGHLGGCLTGACPLLSIPTPETARRATIAAPGPGANQRGGEEVAGDGRAGQSLRNRLMISSG